MTQGTTKKPQTYIGIPDTNYLLGDNGTVWVNRDGQIKPLKQKQRGRYMTITLRIGGKKKTWNVHSLMALYFIGPRPKGKVVCHGRNGALDNSVSNLSYGTSKKNARDRIRDGTHLERDAHPNTVHDEAKVKKIRKMHRQGYTQFHLAIIFDMTQQNISRIIRRRKE